MSRVNLALLISLCLLSKHIWNAGEGIYRRIFHSGEQKQMTAAQARQFLYRLEEFRRELRRTNQKSITDFELIMRSMHENNQLQNERYSKFYDEFVDLRVKVAAYTKDANGHIT